MPSWSCRVTSAQAMPLIQRATSISCCPLPSKPVKPQQEAPPLAEELSEGPLVCAAWLCLNQGKHLFTPQRPLSPDSVTRAPAAIPFFTTVTMGEPTSHPFHQLDLLCENGSGELGHAILMPGQIRRIHSSVLFTEDYLRG